MRTGPEDGGATGPVYLMPPEEFLPFMVPFKGGPGPLCGGACSETFQWSVDSDSYAPHAQQPHEKQYAMQRALFAKHTWLAKQLLISCSGLCVQGILANVPNCQS